MDYSHYPLAQILLKEKTYALRKSKETPWELWRAIPGGFAQSLRTGGEVLVSGDRFEGWEIRGPIPKAC